MTIPFVTLEIPFAYRQFEEDDWDLMKTVDCLLEVAEWTVEDLAERANLTPERTEAIALGRWTPSPAERREIAAAFNISIEEVSWGHTMDPRNVRYRRFGIKDVDDV